MNEFSFDLFTALEQDHDLIDRREAREMRRDIRTTKDTYQIEKRRLAAKVTG